MAGYSPKTLAEKLGLAGGRKAALPPLSYTALILGAPDGYPGILGALPPSIRLISDRAWGKPHAKATFDFIQAFFRSERDLGAAFPSLKKAMAPDGMLWISWPKRIKGSGRTPTVPAAQGREKGAGRESVAGDLDENRVRRLGLAAGLVDIKVCAVDGTWSGLKFVFRLADRG